MDKINSTVRQIGRRGRMALGTLSVAAVGMVVGAGSAFATVPDPTDPTGGAGDTFFSSIASYITGHLIPSVITLTILVVGFGMLLAWGKRAAKSR
jgi:hypothetical protein